MTAREFVLRSIQIKQLSIVKPSKGCPGILVWDDSAAFKRMIVDAQTWAEARDQLIKHYTH